MIDFDKEYKWTVYTHISPSNKYYVGITSRPVSKRWRGNGIEYKSQYFHRAINKYGWDNFQHEVIASHLSEEEAKNFEKILIEKLQSNNPKYGYNITSGGDGCAGIKRSKEHIEAIKKSTSKPVYQFDKEMNFIKEFSGVREAAKIFGLHAKANILNVCHGRSQTAYGYVWRFKDDIKDPFDKINLKGITYKYNQDKIYQINISNYEYIEYDNVKNASEITGYSYNHILECCLDKHETYKGCVWKYKKDIEDIDKYIKDNLRKDFGRKKTVLQYDMNMNYIMEYPSMSEAALKNGLNRKNIAKACDGIFESYGGYIWKHKFENTI